MSSQHFAGTAKAPVARLTAGTMVTTDIDSARRFYQDFLGFECIRYKRDQLVMRDHYSRAAMEAGEDDFFVLCVQQVAEVTNPQRMLHHWGLDVASPEEVNRIHAEASARKDEFGLTKILPVSERHGAHSFYFADRDSNWWEVEYRLNGLDNSDFFARGDIGSEEFEKYFRKGDMPAFLNPAKNVRGGSVTGNARLTHGTCEQEQLEQSRRFVEEILHLRCVRHLQPAQLLAGSGEFCVFAVSPPRIIPQERQNRWVICVDSKAEVEAAQSRARKTSEELAPKNIGEIESEDKYTYVTIQDADGNWWEITDRPPNTYQELFAAGDFC